MRVLVALSGGVDSSAAAFLLKREGFDLVGITMKNWCYGEGEGEGRSCCSLESIEAARQVARALDFPHYVVDFEAPFAAHVIGPFLRDYVEGRTPNPCVECNARVRFPGLWNRARAFGCELFATGHYARLDSTSDPPVFRRPADLSRDQSYVLWAVPAEPRRHFLLPLGELTKADVRRIAAEAGLTSAKRPDSQEICFVPGGDYGAVLEERLAEEGPLPATLSEGPIVDQQGRVLGTHRGVARYTIGQRKGLGVSSREPLYVVALRPSTNEVVVGAAGDLFCTEANLRDVHWPAKEAGEEIEVHVQLRSRHAAAPAVLTRISPSQARVVFRAPQRAISPGQSAVFYAGDRVIGGGIVADGTPSELGSGPEG
jgi:tRNA-specific 2-thiouridylase